MRRHPKADPVTPELRALVLERDGGCVAPLLDPECGPCRDAYGHERSRTFRPILTLDHVKDEPCMAKRAPSDPAHLATVCIAHHLGGWATSHRPELREYLSGRAA